MFYITTQGVLGEQFLAIDPGSSDRPVLEDGAAVRGLDPPRLDRLIAESYDLLHTTVIALREHRPELREMFDGLGKTLKGTGTFMANNQERIDRIAGNVEKMSDEGVKSMVAAREQYIENPRIDRIMVNVEKLSAASARDVPVLLADGRKTLASTNRLVNTLGSEEKIAKLDGIMDDVAAMTKSARKASTDAEAIAARIPCRPRHRGGLGDGRTVVRRPSGTGPRPQTQPLEVFLEGVASPPTPRPDPRSVAALLFWRRRAQSSMTTRTSPSLTA